MAVFADGIQLEPRDHPLRTLPLEKTECIQILSPHAAASLYPNQPLGVMVVTTARGAPAPAAPAAPAAAPGS